MDEQSALCFLVSFCLAKEKKKKGGGRSKGEPINFVAFLASRRLFTVMGVPCFLRLFYYFFFLFEVKTIAKFVHDLMRVGRWKVYVGK